MTLAVDDVNATWKWLSPLRQAICPGSLTGPRLDGEKLGDLVLALCLLAPHHMACANTLSFIQTLSDEILENHL